MKRPAPTRLTALRSLGGSVGLMALLPPVANASYFALTQNTKEAQQCITYDARYPYWTEHIYIATYPGHSRSKEGWIAPYYGGVVSNLRGEPNLIQYASWQMGGKDAPTSGIDFVHAGPHMSWVRSTWEGSSGGIKGLWPTDEFKPKEWYRFVNRVWTPVEPTPHLGYAGVWMKSLTTGDWHHLATFKFPAELTGFDAMGGFCEYITGNATNTCAVEFSNIYAMRNDKWGSEPVFSAFNHKEDIIKMTQPSDKRSVLLETSRTPRDPQTRKFTELPVVTQKVTLNQPALPDFLDAVKITTPTAAGFGTRCVVKWQVAAKDSPQLGYTVAILDGTTVLASAAENDPNARQCVLEIGAVKRRPQARIQITDIFGRQSPPVIIPVTTASPLPALKEAALPAGLSYRYYESKRPDDWQTLPDFPKLTPKRQGVVTAPDLTPRLNRTGYAFEFTGFLRVPTAGLYAFNLIAASGARLILDDTVVIDAADYHSIAKSPGTVALNAGLHKFALPYFQGARQYQQADDFLQLTWSGPGLTDQPIPVSAFCRELPTGAAEPKVVLKAVQQGEAGTNLMLSADVSPADLAVARIEYYATNPGFDYYSAQGAHGAEYFLTDSKTPGTPVPAVIWGGGEKALHARLVDDQNRTFDSAPLIVPATPAGGTYGDFQLTQLEHHLYPMAASADADSITLVGESMGLLTKPLTGDGTLVARLAEITSNRRQADGTELMDANNWFAGIILRDTLAARPGEPLGGSAIPYAAIMGSAERQTRYCDSTMINGAGNQPDGAGDANPWFRIERKGADFTLSDSADGKTWKTIKTVTLPKMSPTLHAGFLIYAIPSATNRVHWARFDNISFTPAAVGSVPAK